MLGNFACFDLSSAEFFKINAFEKFSHEYNQCQTDWIQIRTDKMSGLIFIQTVRECYQQTTAFRQRVH